MTNEYDIALSIIKEVGVDQCSIWDNHFGVTGTLDEQWTLPSTLSRRFGIPFYATSIGNYNGTEYGITHFDMGKCSLPIQVRAYSEALRIPEEDMSDFINGRIETYIAENRSVQFKQHILCFQIFALIYGYDVSDYIPFTVDTLKEGAH